LICSPVIAPLCFSTLGCPSASVEEVCLLARRFGLNRIEIRSLEGRVDFPGLLARDVELLEKTIEILRRHAVQPLVIGSSFHLTNSRAADIPALQAVCRVADALGANYVRVFGGGRERVPLSREEIQAAAALHRAAEEGCRATEARCQLLVETHGGLVTSEGIRKFLDLAGADVFLLWDSHHTWKLGGEAPEKTFPEIAARVRHIHCKDSRVVNGSPGAYEYVLPGQGEFPFGGLFKTLAGAGIPLSLEWEKQWHPELPDLPDALAAWKMLAASSRIK
jgi:sugar phosphate isomerase/epimerase